MTVIAGAIEAMRVWWDEKVRAWTESGLRQGQYCEREGLSCHAFRYYRHKWMGRILGGGRAPTGGPATAISSQAKALAT